jgi:hypothetical protein
MLCYFEMPRKTARRRTVPRRAGGVAAQGLANRPGRRHFSSPGQTYAAERFSVICVALVSAAVGRRLALPMMVILTPSFDGTGPVRSPGYLIRFNRCICGWHTSCRMMPGPPIKLGNLQVSRGGRLQSGIPAVVNVDRRQQQNL